MTKFGTYLLSAATLLVFLGMTACGSTSRQLQSITVSSGGNVSMQYTATGTFNKAPATVSPLPVSWYVVNSAVIANVSPPDYGYTLTSEPYSLNPCVLTDTVVALAPMDPNAPTSGGIPSKVYQDLVVTHTVSVEGGFVAAAAPANCSQ